MKLYVLKHNNKFMKACSNYNTVLRAIKAEVKFKEFLINTPPPTVKIDKPALLRETANFQEMYEQLSIREHEEDITSNYVGIYSKNGFLLEYKEVDL